MSEATPEVPAETAQDAPLTTYEYRLRWIVGVAPFGVEEQRAHYTKEREGLEEWANEQGAKGFRLVSWPDYFMVMERITGEGGWTHRWSVARP